MTIVKGSDNFDKMPQIGGVDIVPSGGTAGQALVKDTGSDYDYSWQDITPSGLAPAGGSSGQVLTKDTGTDYDYSWQDSTGSDFGSEHQEDEKTTSQSTSSTSFQQYFQMTTPSVPAGKYRFAFYATGRMSSTSYDARVRCQIDNSNTIPNNDVGEFRQEHNDSGSDQRLGWSGFGYVTFGSAGAHNIDVDFRSSSSSGTCYIYSCHIEFWRIS